MNRPPATGVPAPGGHDGEPKSTGPEDPRGLPDVPLRTWLEIALLAALLVAGFFLLRYLKPHVGDNGAKIILVAAAAALSGLYSAARWLTRRLSRPEAEPPAPPPEQIAPPPTL